MMGTNQQEARVKEESDLKELFTGTHPRARVELELKVAWGCGSGEWCTLP